MPTCLKRRPLLAAFTWVVACSPTPPTAGGATDTDTDTDTDAPSESGETDEDTGDIVPDLGTEPPPDCLAWSKTSSFADLCFEPPAVIDPTPVNFVKALTGGYYVAGSGTHRFYSDTSVHGEYTDLPLTGTTVGWISGASSSVIMTSDPHALVMLSFSADSKEVIGEFALDAAPTSGLVFTSESGKKIVVADVAGDLQFFTFANNILEPAGSRSLPEAVTQLELDRDQFGGDRLLGRASESSTMWRVNTPIDNGGELFSWSPPVEVSTWTPTFVSGTAVTQPLLFGRSPSTVVLYQAFLGLEFNPPLALDYAINHSMWGQGPSPSPGSGWGIFGLSTESARVGQVIQFNEDSYEIRNPDRWVEVPPDTVSLILVSGVGFVCASTSAGLALVAVK